MILWIVKVLTAFEIIIYTKAEPVPKKDIKSFFGTEFIFLLTNGTGSVNLFFKVKIVGKGEER